ncbi:hypothetical protein ACJRO7_026946 [Eucalyptus globulus]|uniref:CN hydrolase domain-containing protein n=1 Tax=Eucalyptus globulus TaxID=34317 RepID=A0ABD3JWU8_EUCGL
MIDSASASEVNILFLQEAWIMPFAFCTGEKRWCEFAEPTGEESTRFLQDLGYKPRKTIWNTAEVIGNNWNIIGKHRKLSNHIPRVGDFKEKSYSMKEILGILCLRLLRKDRCQYLLWEAPSVELAFGSKGARIVFNPYATVGELSKLMWLIEVHNAAIANGYSVGSINRVGTGSFPNPFASGDGKPQHTDFWHFYGSNGLLVSDMDLNFCRQLQDKGEFRMTARYELWSQPRLLPHQLAKNLPLISFRPSTYLRLLFYFLSFSFSSYVSRPLAFLSRFCSFSS